jgi:acyl-CoA reductase-like NAD-dependent aldehyde dehydrogenase
MGMMSQPQASQNGEARKIASFNPATGELLGEVPIQGPEEVRAAVARAREAQRAWASLPPRMRAERVLAYRDLWLARSEEMVELISRESGKTRQEAFVIELAATAIQVTHFANRLEKVLAPRDIPMSVLVHRKGYLHYAPRGVAGVISPWNFPFTLPIGAVLMNLLAGNGAVLKPSEAAPLIALKAKALYDEAGLPPDLFQVVTGNAATGAALIDGGVDHLTFIGSVAGGRKVGRACSERLIPCSLELGGKAPALVFPNVDLDRVAQALVFGSFVNSGQACAAIERVYLHEDIHDRMLEKILALTRELRQGNPLSFDTDIGAMCFAHQLDIVKQQVADAVSKGARLETGGVAREGAGMFYAPTVLSGVTHDMAVIKEETFAPVMPIVKFRDTEEAIEMANDTHLGLSAYVFEDDTTRARAVAERILAGTVSINDVGVNWGMPESPWAGIKSSGLGRTFSDDGLRDLCLTMHINYNRFKLLPREIWWYPYTERTYRLIKRSVNAYFSKGVLGRVKAFLRDDDPAR